MAIFFKWGGGPGEGYSLGDFFNFLNKTEGGNWQTNLLDDLPDRGKNSKYGGQHPEI